MTVGEKLGHRGLESPAELLAAWLKVVFEHDVGGPVARHFLHKFQRHTSGQGQSHPGHAETVEVPHARPAQAAFTLSVNFATDNLGLLCLTVLALLVRVLEAGCC